MKLRFQPDKRFIIGIASIMMLYILHFFAIRIMASFRIVESLMTNGGLLSVWAFGFASFFILLRVFVIVIMPGLIFMFFWRYFTK